MPPKYLLIPGLVMSVALVIASGCQSTSTTNYGSTAGSATQNPGPAGGAPVENERRFSIDAAGGVYSVSLFPKTYSAVMGPGFSLVVVSPVLLADEVLYNSGSSSLIPWFNARGVAVWLVRIPPQMPLERFGRDILPTITAAIRKNSNDADWVMAGVSLGGQAIAQYLADAQRNATISGMLVRSAFFLGTGFDYNYPGSFGKRLALAQDGESKNLCAADFCKRFFNGLKSEQIVSRKNLFDTGGKPVWRDSLDNVAIKDKGVRVMFIAGKIDNVAPTESVYRFFVKTIGDETKNSPDVRFLVPGRMNRHSRDFDHAAVVASDDLASDILPEVLKFIDL